MRRTVGITILVVIGLAVIGSAGMWWLRSKRGKDRTFHTVPVKRGDLMATISATGTLEPEAAVDIGAQVAGVIIAFGKDKGGKEIQWGSVVEKGMVLAKIDDSLYAAAVETAKGQLEQAIANKVSADANVLQMKAKLVDAQQDWGRAQKLGPSDALAQSAYDQYQANYEVAKANLAAAEAAVEQTKAAVAQAKANLDTAQINLAYCTIKSPVNGVVVDRQVNIGQTVVSSLSTPNLFIIATDLKRIQAWVSVNEADIGSIFIGQPVTFTVDAHPGRVFKGQVGQVRLNATMLQNVVTYTVRVDTNNDDGKLLPYLTTNVRFTLGRRQDVLLVPNTALHWSPKPNQISPEAGQTARAPGVSSSRDSGGGAGAVGAPKVHGTIWVEQGEFVRPVRVNAGLTDGTSTEVEGKDLTEGMRVVVGEATREVAGGASADRSPFTPQIGRGLRQGQTSSGTASGGR
ncbi:MAG TPA: efflux RND transporter periplasmic adaptor subunit [Thermodesulfobacteriota bacterium]|nr:efflux RND transporter periplasmic adaptor subunit [Thermodesulfobacteriota bacterium]